MIITLNEAKQYCAIDFDDDDMFIESLCAASEIALKQQTGRNEFNNVIDLAKLYCLAFIKQMYDDKGLTTEKTDKLKHTMQNILMLIKFDEGDIVG